MDANENEHTSRRYAAVFFVLVTKFMMICHYQTNFNASFIRHTSLYITNFVNNRQKTSADGI